MPRLSTDGGCKAPYPSSFRPQLATLSDSPPDGDNWLNETKFDGYRLLGFVRAGKVRLMTRNEQDWTHRFPRIEKELLELPIKDGILDGEVIAPNAAGISDFQALQNSLSGSGNVPLVYYVFDLPYCNGFQLTQLPLIQRKTLLEQIVSTHPAQRKFVRYTQHIQGNGPHVYREACRYALEGIVAKRSDSPYVQARSRSWLKLKCTLRQEFVVGGYTKPRGSRQHFGSLALGYYSRAHEFIPCGHVGTGFSDKILGDLQRRLARLRQSHSPFSRPLPARLRKDIVWIKPQLVCEVRFTGWTSDGVLRHPVFEGLREDKNATKIVLERPIH